MKTGIRRKTPTHHLPIQSLAILVINAALAASIPALAADCVLPPSGLVGWWPGEGDANDLLGTNNGMLMNGATFASGIVGQAFSFNGVSSLVQIPTSPSLNPTGSFSIEAWVYPHQDSLAEQALVKKWSDYNELYNQRSYVVSLMPGRSIEFGISDLAHQSDKTFHVFETDSGAITLNAWNHVVAIYDQSAGTRRIFLNGMLAKSRTDTPITILNGVAPLCFGGWVRGGGHLEAFFDGLLDEVSLYNRALSEPQVQALYNAGSAGKCHVPIITSQPQSQVGYWGEDVSFQVKAGGSPPLSYQWYIEGFQIPWGTNAVLTLTDLEFADAGEYWVEVSNLYGTATSDPATLIVNPAGVSLGLYPGLTISGAVGKNFGIQYVTGFGVTNNWITITNLTLTQPVQLWMDTNVNVSGGSPKRFYRVIAIP